MSSDTATLPGRLPTVIRRRNVRATDDLALDRELTEHERRWSSLGASSGGILLDYLRAVLPDTPATWSALDRWLGVRVGRGRGWRGFYDESWAVLDGGIVAACSDPERAKVQKVMVDLPGAACASMGDRLVPFMRWCLATGRLTRVDWALDDREGLLTRDRIVGAWESGGVVTRWQSMTTIEKRKANGPGAWSVYFGSRSSTAYTRIYDKAAQMGVKGPWVRFEIETKGKLADGLARRYFEIGAVAVIRQINRRIRFCRPTGGDSNKRRWAVCEWWGRFLGSLKRGLSLLAGEVVEHTIDRARFWVERQVMPWLAAMLQADHGDVTWLFGAMDRGRARWRPHHLAALNHAGVAL